MTRAWSIYVLCDPRTGEAGYVGLTSQRVDERLAAHMSKSRCGGSAPVSAWIAALDEEPSVWVAETHSCRDAAAEAERWLIAYLRSVGADLRNDSEGGEGHPTIEDPKTLMILVRVRKDERAAMQRAADEAGRPLSSWVRDVALERAKEE